MIYFVSYRYYILVFSLLVELWISKILVLIKVDNKSEQKFPIFCLIPSVHSKNNLIAFGFIAKRSLASAAGKTTTETLPLVDGPINIRRRQDHS